MSDPMINYFTPGDVHIPVCQPAPGTVLPAADFPQNAKLPLLFQPTRINGVDFKNRIQIAPMCQYSAETVDGVKGVLSQWHTVHLGALAARGAGLVIIEATAVLPNGGITPQCPGLWDDVQAKRLKEVVSLIHALGAKAGIQLAHAGRKASTVAPWLGGSTIKAPLKNQVAPVGEAGGWTDVWAPSAIKFVEGYPEPFEMTLDQIDEFKQAWVRSVKLADAAGVDAVEIHSAHGYLLSSFLSPLSNRRTDKYGGSLENRMRLTLEVVELCRAALPAHKPLILRISATDWHVAGETDEQGEYISWGIEQSKVLLKEAIKRGIDQLDVSSGGNDIAAKINVGPDYQVQFARELRASMDGSKTIPISAVGLITTGTRAEEILQKGDADIISVGREALRNADLVFDWAMELGTAVNVPVQYQWAFRCVDGPRLKSDAVFLTAVRTNTTNPPSTSFVQEDAQEARGQGEGLARW